MFISFNLVIEVLVVSSTLRPPELFTINLFQSRNRGTCRFKTDVIEYVKVIEYMFQSRNRGTCRFKSKERQFVTIKHILFQSRNRGTCRFKRFRDTQSDSLWHRFNLVIEVLVVSRYQRASENCLTPPCFNLVIEVLVVSSIQTGFGCSSIDAVSIS